MVRSNVAAEAPAASPIAEIPENLRYDVVNQDVIQTSRRSLSVRLSQPVDEDVLEALAYKLRSPGNASPTIARVYQVGAPGFEPGTSCSQSTTLRGPFSLIWRTSGENFVVLAYLVSGFRWFNACEHREKH